MAHYIALKRETLVGAGPMQDGAHTNIEVERGDEFDAAPSHDDVLRALSVGSIQPHEVPKGRAKPEEQKALRAEREGKD